MDWLIALGHIAGSIVAVITLGIAMLLAGTWLDERIQKQAQAEFAVRLGVSVTDLNKEELASRIVELSSARFSSDLLQNRLSDFCAVIRTLWGWLGSLLEILVIGGVIWYTFADSKEAAVFAWFIVGIALFFYITSLTFSFLCFLLTGRYPGQAKSARKAMSEYMNSRTRSAR